MPEKRIHHMFFILLFLAVGLIIYGIFNFDVDNVVVDSQEVLSMNAGWTLHTKNGVREKSALSLKFNVDAEEKISLSYNIPKGWEGSTLFFQSRDQLVRVMYGESKLYEFGAQDSRVFGKTPGSAIHFVDIPKTSGEDRKKLIIMLWSPYQNYGGVLKQVLIGSKSACLLYWVRQNLVPFLLCFLMLLLEIILLVIYLYYRKIYVNTKNLLYLSIFSLICFVYSVIETRLPQFFYGNASVYSLITFLMIMLSPIPLTLYVKDSLLVTYQRIYQKFACMFMGAFVISIVLQITNIFDFMQSIVVFHAMICASIVYTFTVLYRIIKANKADKKTIYLAVALFLLLVSIAIDVIRNYVFYVTDVAYIQRFGFLCFILIVSRVSIGDLLELSRRGLEADVLQRCMKMS